MAALPIHLGRSKSGESFTLPLSALSRHFLALGGTGSGKTVLCKAVIEECIRYRLPCIAIDLQGDILSLALQSMETPSGAVPVSEATRAKYAERLDVKVWTPGSRDGIPLSMSPDMTIPDVAAVEDRIALMESIAQGLGNMLGNSKEGTIAGFYTILEYADQHGLECSNLDDLSMFLADPPAELAAELEHIMPAKVRSNMLSSLKIRLKGMNGLMYAMGQGIDIDELFGLRLPGPLTYGKARLSIIYLAHLSQERQQEFLALLFSSMYSWMLTQDDSLSGVLYLDEIAPFCPPVSKPPAKAGLMLLLRQARKYGLCTVLATQSPGDLDYKALGQIGTVALGRITQGRDIGKVDGMLRSMPNVDAGAIVEALPGHKRGEFVIVNSDHLAAPESIQARWLATEHRLVAQKDIGAFVSDDDREILG